MAHFLIEGQALAERAEDHSEPSMDRCLSDKIVARMGMNREPTCMELLHGQPQSSGVEGSPQGLVEPALEGAAPGQGDGVLVALKGGGQPPKPTASDRASVLGLQVFEACHTEKLYAQKPYVHTKNHPDASGALSISERVELVGACTIFLADLKDEALCAWAQVLLGPSHPAICRLSLTRLVSQKLKNHTPDDGSGKRP